MARPKLPAKHRRSRALPPVRVTAAEYRLLSDAAKGLGKNLSDFVREAVVAALPAHVRAEYLQLDPQEAVIEAEVQRVGAGPAKVRIKARLRPEDVG